MCVCLYLGNMVGCMEFSVLMMTRMPQADTKVRGRGWCVNMCGLGRWLNGKCMCVCVCVCVCAQIIKHATATHLCFIYNTVILCCVVVVVVQMCWCGLCICAHVCVRVRVNV